MTQPTPIPIYQQAEPFYVPQFVVKVKGNALPDEVVEDVMQVTYKDSIDEIDSFEIMLNNWDAETRQFKYEPPLSKEIYKGVFDPGKQIELQMGYANNLRLMMTGEITTLELDFPNGGGPTLEVRGLNVLHTLRTEQHTYAWENKKDSEIAEWLGNQPRKAKSPGLGMTVKTPAKADEQPETYVFMHNQFDIVFLMERARRHGYEVVLVTPEDGSKPYLQFGPSDSKGERPVYSLEWGNSLISFRPTLTTAKQVSEVVVQGWDRRTNKPITAKFGLSDLTPKSGPEHDRRMKIGEAYGNRREIVTNRPVHTPGEAKQLAQNLFEQHQKQMITASGATVGLSDLRAGRYVQILLAPPLDKNAAPRDPASDKFNGMYYITKSTHVIGSSGYRTNFEARREDALQDKAAAQK